MSTQSFQIFATAGNVAEDDFNRVLFDESIEMKLNRSVRRTISKLECPFLSAEWALDREYEAPTGVAHAVEEDSSESSDQAHLESGDSGGAPVAGRDDGWACHGNSNASRPLLPVLYPLPLPLTHCIYRLPSPRGSSRSLNTRRVTCNLVQASRYRLSGARAVQHAFRTSLILWTGPWLWHCKTPSPDARTLRRL